MEILGILRKIDNIDVAKEYLLGILIFLRALGYSSLLLAIDEFEYLFSLVPRTQYSIYLALLRGLYDFPLGIPIRVNFDKVAKLVLFIAISEDGWRHLEELEKRETLTGGPISALLDRIDEITLLTVFDKNSTRQLIEKRLSYNRIKGKFEDEPLIPFTEDFVDLIYKKTQGNPRKIIELCGHILDAGLADRVPILDKEYAEKVIEERGLV